MATELAKAYVQIIPSADGIGGKIEELLGGPETEKAGESAGSTFGSALKTGAAVAAKAIAGATGAAAAFAGSSIKVGSSFDAAMSQVAATTGSTTEEIKTLRDFAQEMGSTTAFSATQAAEALNYTSLAGYTAEESMSALPGILNLAAAGNIDLAAASDMVTDAQSALNLTMDGSAELIDMMAMASSRSNTSIAQLGSAILTVGGTAANLAGGTNELNTALGILADNGIKGAEGGTLLRNVILSLSAPGEKAASTMEELGVSALDADGNFRPLNEIFTEFSESLSTMSQGEQTQVLNKIFNKVDLKGVTAMLSAASQEIEGVGNRFDELSGYIDSAAGSAEKMAETQLDNLAGDVTLLQSAFEGVQITLSDQLTPTLREFVQFGADGLSRINDAFKTDGLSGAMDEMGEILSEGLSMIVGILPEFIEAGAQLLGSFAEGILDNLPQIVEAALEIILTLSGGIADSLPELIPTIVDVVLEIVETLIANADKLVEAAIEIITALAEGLINSIPVLVEHLPQIVVSIVDGIITSAPKLIAAGLELMLALGKGILDSVGAVLGVIPETIGRIKDAFHLKDAFQWGKDLIDNFVGGIKSMISSVANVASNIAQTVKDFLHFSEPDRGPLSNFHTYAPDMMQLFAKGIADNEQIVAEQLNRSLGFNPANIGFGYNYTGARIGTVGAFGSGANAEIVAAIYAVADELVRAIQSGGGSLTIGDDVIGRSYDRYSSARGVRVSRGAFANAY